MSSGVENQTMKTENYQKKHKISEHDLTANLSWPTILGGVWNTYRR